MANGDTNGDDKPVPEGFERHIVRNKAGDRVPVIAKIGVDAERIKQLAAQEFAKRARTPTIADMPGAFVRGITRGVAGQLSPLGQAAQIEMGQVGPGYAPVPGVEQTRKILEQQFVPGHLAHDPVTFGGKAVETAGEFLVDPASWIGPGGPTRKALTVMTGALGATLGERYAGVPGRVVGGGIGGALGGQGFRGAGLPERIPKEIREATTEDAVKAASKAGYEQLKEFEYALEPGQNLVLNGAIKRYLIEEEGTTYDDLLAPTTWAILDRWMPRARTVADVERVRQQLNSARLEGGNEALAASKAIEALDDYMYALPGVKDVAQAARGNWAAYKRGQMVEETIRRGVERANVSGKGGGANIVNTIKQEFKRRIRDKPEVWKRFNKDEQKQIELIMEPGRGLDVAHWLSNFAPRNPITGAIAFFGAGHVTGDPLSQIAVLAGTGELAHRYVKRMTTGRGARLLEATRARSPAGAEAAGLPAGTEYKPPPAPSPERRAGYGAARALGATALSPGTTEALELPEIEVTAPKPRTEIPDSPPFQPTGTLGIRG